MKRLYIGLFLVAISLWVGCDYDIDTEGVQTQLAAKWRFVLKDTRTYKNLTGHFANNLPQYKHIGVMFGNKRGRAIIYGLDAFSGEAVWELEFDPSPPHNLSTQRSYVKDYLWVFSMLNTLYCIDLRDGHIRWEAQTPNKDNFESSSVEGSGNYCYAHYLERVDSKGLVTRCIRVNINTGASTPFLDDLPYQFIGPPPGSKYYGAMYVHPLPTVSGETTQGGQCLVEYAYTIDSVKFTNAMHIGLYDIGSSSWVYDHEVGQGDVGVTVTNDNDDIANGCYYRYDADPYTRCYDILTGELIWEHREPSDFGNSSYRSHLNGNYHEGKIYLSYSSDSMVVLDASTGDKLYEIENGGYATPIQFYRGVGYFITTDWQLRAFDTETGQLLWRIPSPDLETEGHFWIMGNKFALVPALSEEEKGRILITTHLHAYGYETVR